MWDLPGPGLEPVSPALAGGFLTTAPPGKSSNSCLLMHCLWGGSGRWERVQFLFSLGVPGCPLHLRMSPQTLSWTCALRCFFQEQDEPHWGNPILPFIQSALWPWMQLVARWKLSVVFASSAAIPFLANVPMVSLEIHPSPTLSPWDLARSRFTPGSRANDPGLANQNISLLTRLVDSGTSIQNQWTSVVGLLSELLKKKETLFPLVLKVAGYKPRANGAALPGYEPNWEENRMERQTKAEPWSFHLSPWIGLYLKAVHLWLPY